jgi:hypothetical protein
MEGKSLGELLTHVKVLLESIRKEWNCTKEKDDGRVQPWGGVNLAEIREHVHGSFEQAKLLLTSFREKLVASPGVSKMSAKKYLTTLKVLFYIEACVVKI